MTGVQTCALPISSENESIPSETEKEDTVDSIRPTAASALRALYAMEARTSPAAIARLARTTPAFPEEASILTANQSASVTLSIIALSRTVFPTPLRPVSRSGRAGPSPRAARTIRVSVTPKLTIQAGVNNLGDVYYINDDMSSQEAGNAGAPRNFFARVRKI